jgi:hypothetical protein
MFVEETVLNILMKVCLSSDLKFITALCIVSRLTNVNSSTNLRFSQKNTQQNFQEAMAFVKTILKTRYIYSVFHKVGKLSYKVKNHQLLNPPPPFNNVIMYII